MKRVMEFFGAIFLAIIIMGLGLSGGSQNAERGKKTEILPKVIESPKPKKQLMTGGYALDVDWFGNSHLVACVDDNYELVDIKTGKREIVEELRGKGRFNTLKISPDHRSIVYKDDGSLVLFDLLKREKKKLPVSIDMKKGYYFSWSPDGESFSYEIDGTLWVLLKGKRPEKLGQGYEFPQWRNNGKNIIVKKKLEKESVGSGYWDINLIDGKERKYIDKMPYGQLFPDGTKSEFIENRFIYIYDFKTKARTRIGELYNENPWGLDPGCSVRVSPDGKKIAYNHGTFNVEDGEWHPGMRVPIENMDIFVYDMKSGKTINVTATSSKYEINPRWSPDSKKILCFRADNVMNFGLDPNKLNPRPIIIQVK